MLSACLTPGEEDADVERARGSGLATGGACRSQLAELEAMGLGEDGRDLLKDAVRRRGLHKHGPGILEDGGHLRGTTCFTRG